MIYQDYEIFARVWGSYSDLYELKKDGSLGKHLDIKVDNDDLQIVWFEIEMFDGQQFKTIEEAEVAINKHINEFPIENE